MQKVLLHFSFKRAYIFVQFPKVRQHFMDFQHPTKRENICLNFICYSLQTVPVMALFMWVYITAISISKLCTVCQCLWNLFQMKFYVLTRTFWMLIFLNQSVTSLQAQISTENRGTMLYSLNHCAFTKRKLCRCFVQSSFVFLCVCSPKCKWLMAYSHVYALFLHAKPFLTSWEADYCIPVPGQLPCPIMSHLTADT